VLQQLPGVTRANSDRRQSSRRFFLGSVAAGTVALAGCSSGSGDESRNDREKLDQPPEGPPVLGDPDAAITLEVFEDFNCPHCQDYSAEGFPEVKSAYLDSEQIRYVHRDLPFIHETSWQAASAAREVYREYGTEPFFAYTSALMSEGRGIRADAPEVFGEVARAEGLDNETIQQAGANRMHDERIREDRMRAEELGVQATPGFVVDGEVMGGLDDARETIDTKLSE
jgi:protein-disulfide isomerase